MFLPVRMQKRVESGVNLPGMASALTTVSLLSYPWISAWVLVPGSYLMSFQLVTTYSVLLTLMRCSSSSTLTSTLNVSLSWILMLVSSKLSWKKGTKAYCSPTVRGYTPTSLFSKERYRVANSLCAWSSPYSMSREFSGFCAQAISEYCLMRMSVLQARHWGVKPPQLLRLQASLPDNAPLRMNRYDDSSKLISGSSSQKFSRSSFFRQCWGMFSRRTLGSWMLLSTAIYSIQARAARTAPNITRTTSNLPMCYQLMDIQIEHLLIKVQERSVSEYQNPLSPLRKIHGRSFKLLQSLAIVGKV